MQTRVRNRDGSLNVYCSRCEAPLGSVRAEALFASALCVVCQAADAGICFPPEVVRQLRSKTTDVQFSDPLYDPMFGRDVTPEEMAELSNTPQYKFKTIRQRLRDFVDRVLPPKPEELVSKQVAKEKRTPRVFQRPRDS